MYLHVCNIWLKCAIWLKSILMTYLVYLYLLCYVDIILVVSMNEMTDCKWIHSYSSYGWLSSLICITPGGNFELDHLHIV